MAPETEPRIPDAERRVLLAIAREAIAAALHRRVEVAIVPPPALAARRARAFVTLRRRGKLRGCIGHLSTNRPLPDVIRSCALAAAQSDPRFPPLEAAELNDIDVEVSVLGEFQPVASVGEIEIGRHGLMVERRGRAGLLLPQVATEWGWDASTFAAQTCKKAGFAPDAWPSGGAVMHRFEAEVFGDASNEPAHA